MSKAPYTSALIRTIQEFSQYPRLAQALQTHSLSRNLHLLAIGKAAWQMASIALKNLSPESILDGYVLTKYGHVKGSLTNLQIREAGHPIPDANSFLHTREILTWLSSLPPQDELIVLLSGGGSALFEAVEVDRSPDEAAYQARITNLINLHEMLLGSGLDIAQMNRRRSELSSVKAGKALRFVPCHKIHVFALSDVQYNDPLVIASGPFTGDDRVEYQIIGDNLSFLKLWKSHMSPEFRVQIARKFLSDSAFQTARHLAGLALNAAPGIYLFGGETPVKVRGSGKGGRCSHLALCFAGHIQGDPSISLLAFATDGHDNLSESSGAWVNGTTFKRIREAGIDPINAIRNNDSYPALAAIGQIMPDLNTHCNVNDVFMVVKSRG